MPVQTNEQLVRDYFRSPGPEPFVEDAQLHDTSQPGPLRGRESIGAFLRMFHDAFPDGAYELHHVVADAALCMAEWTFRGINTGPAMGVPPTGRRVEFSGVSVFEIQGGRFARGRIYYDTGTLADQLGLTGERVPRSERSAWADWWERQR